MYHLKNWLGYTYAHTIATPTPVIPPTQDELRKELRFPLEKKPDAYKNINSSSIRVTNYTENRNLK